MMKIMTAAQAVQQYKKHLQKMNRQCYIEKEYIILNVHYPYDIELSRLDSHKKLLAWVHHLSGKNWMTVELMRYFIEIVSEHFKMNIYIPA